VSPAKTAEPIEMPFGHIWASISLSHVMAGMVIRTMRYKDTRVMMSLYETLVRPHVEYCVSAWNPHHIKDKKLIEKVQRRFTKMINNMEGKTYEERLQCLKL